jgi:hypothetical protein
MNLRVFHTRHVFMIWNFNFSGVWSMKKQGQSLIPNSNSHALLSFPVKLTVNSINIASPLLQLFCYSVPCLPLFTPLNRDNEIQKA